MMPRWIKKGDLMQYFTFICDDSESIEINITLRKLLQIAHFFRSDKIICKIIEEEVIPRLNNQNAFLYLEDSYQKLIQSNLEEEVEDIWFKLFYNTTDYISKHFLDIFINNISSLEKIPKKVITEIFDRFLNHIFVGNLKVKIYNELMSDLVKFIYRINNSENIYQILIDEYFSVFSEDNLRDLITQKPVFQIDLPLSLGNYYNECSISYFNQLMTFIFYYKKQEDNFYVYLKPQFEEKNNQWLSNTFSFLFSVVLRIKNDGEGGIDYKLKEMEELNPNNYKEKDPYGHLKLLNISNSKSQKLVCLISNFSKKLNTLSLSQSHTVSKSNSFKSGYNLKILIKPCHLHAFLMSEIIKNFSKYYNLPKIDKLSKESISFILKSNPICENPDHVVLSFMNWRKNHFKKISGL